MREYTADEKINYRKKLPSKYWSAGVIITKNIKDKRHILLVRDHRDKWNTPGGVGDMGEHLADTAVREVHEELNLTINKSEISMCYLECKSVDIQGTSESFHDDSWQTLWALKRTLTTAEEAKIKVDGKEILEWQWVKWEKTTKKTHWRIGRRLKDLQGMDIQNPSVIYKEVDR